MLICSRYISTTALNKWFIPNLNFFLLSYQNLPVPQVGGFGGVVLFGFFSADHHVFFLILLKIDENKVTAIICIIGKERYRWYYWNIHYFVMALFLHFTYKYSQMID